MLCCVSRRAVAGADLGPAYGNRSAGGPLPVLLERVEVESDPEEDTPPVLLPCAICARTFMPQSLEKHTRICERAAAKKRKPFDSAKQRIQGTELAEFLPKQERRHRHADEKPTAKSSWKQTHDEFLRAIRAARGDVPEPSVQRQPGVATATSGAPTRANEKGACPTCNRQFGIKAYERHVAWCKERSTRVPASPATNVAKERLEARMKYRAPALKNRRPTNREKYAPGSAVALNMASKASPPSAANRPKESASVPSCNRGGDGGGHSPAKQRPAVVRRSGQARENSGTVGPVKSRVADRTNSGAYKDYDPFLLAEQQMNELLSDTSDPSITDDSSPPSHGRETAFPLSHSSAFAKYPHQSSNPSPDRRSSLIAPPTEFDDLTSDFSSDSTETNSLSREVFLSSPKGRQGSTGEPVASRSPPRELGRRVIIDKSKALGADIVDEPVNRGDRSFVGSAERARKILDKVAPKAATPAVARSRSVRASSAPKIAPKSAPKAAPKPAPKSALDRKNPSNPGAGARRCPGATSEQGRDDALANRRNNNYAPLSGSNLSLSSIVSSDADMKRSNSLFEELMSSFEDDRNSFPSFRSLLRDDPLSTSSPVHDGRHRNGRVSDEELSSPDSYKRQEHGKLSADSAYSSLNRKYSNHGRSANDVGRLDEDATRNSRRDCGSTAARCKMSKFCHECGSRFPETAKFCCECGVRRLAL